MTAVHLKVNESFFLRAQGRAEDRPNEWVAVKCRWSITPGTLPTTTPPPSLDDAWVMCPLSTGTADLTVSDAGDRLTVIIPIVVDMPVNVKAPLYTQQEDKKTPLIVTIHDFTGRRVGMMRLDQHEHGRSAKQFRKIRAGVYVYSLSSSTKRKPGLVITPFTGIEQGR